MNMNMIGFEKHEKHLLKDTKRIAEERAEADQENRESFENCYTVADLANAVLEERGPIPHGEFAVGSLQESISEGQREVISEKIYNVARQCIAKPESVNEILGLVGDEPLRERLAELMNGFFSNGNALVEALEWTDPESVEGQRIAVKLDALNKRIKE